jgi:granule-bound starch synthase
VVEPSDVKKVATTLKRAVKVIGTPTYQEMVKNCMSQDLSWKVLYKPNNTSQQAKI